MRLVLSKGVEGLCVYLNDYRIAGPKPWGGGTTVREWKIEREDVKTALGPDTPPDDADDEDGSCDPSQTPIV